MFIVLFVEGYIKKLSSNSNLIRTDGSYSCASFDRMSCPGQFNMTRPFGISYCYDTLLNTLFFSEQNKLVNRNIWIQDILRICMYFIKIYYFWNKSIIKLCFIWSNIIFHDAAKLYFLNDIILFFNWLSFKQTYYCTPSTFFRPSYNLKFFYFPCNKIRAFSQNLQVKLTSTVFSTFIMELCLCLRFLCHLKL